MATSVSVHPHLKQYTWTKPVKEDWNEAAERPFKACQAKLAQCLRVLSCFVTMSECVFPFISSFSCCLSFHHCIFYTSFQNLKKKKLQTPFPGASDRWGDSNETQCHGTLYTSAKWHGPEILQGGRGEGEDWLLLLLWCFASLFLLPSPSLALIHPTGPIWAF